MDNSKVVMVINITMIQDPTCSSYLETKSVKSTKNEQTKTPSPLLPSVAVAPGVAPPPTPEIMASSTLPTFTQTPKSNQTWSVG